MKKRVEIIQSEINELNEIVKKGDIEITKSHGVWGPRAFKTKDGKLEITHVQGKFYGGGISDNYYTFMKNGKKQFTTDNLLEAEKVFYDNLFEMKG